jgi:alkylation response protein AidB-like acyl-CoA dehydrogenase
LCSWKRKAAIVITGKTLKLSVKSLKEFAKKRLPDQELIALDERDECPIEIVRHLCNPDKIGIQLLFIPEEFGGFGGGAFDVYCICEEMARIDLGVATAVLATFLGSDPITVGATPEQKKLWLSRIAEEGLLFAYGATEPDAGSDLGALQTTADRVMDGDRVVGYRINGSKQWISNGGVADAYTVLANTPAGPSWFIVERGAAGFTQGKPEDKHGIRTSNTAALSFSDVTVDSSQLVGGVEGQGLLQAQAVFGYTRLMVAAFGLGAGWAALDRAIPYSTKRIQAGAPLSEKQGYTHKLIVPNVARLEAGRAYIEETAERIDAGEGSLNTEGAIAKYMSTEAGNMAAEASIQALGGYGYTHEYMVEKISRDVRITTIYEGTSEIMEMTISRDRWQLHLKTRGQHYHERAREMEALHARRPNVGAGCAALALHALAEAMERARAGRLTRYQHILLRMGEWIAYAESAATLARRAARMAEGRLNEKANQRFDPEALAAISRVFAREAALKVAQEGLRWIVGAGPAASDGEVAAFEAALNLSAIHRAQAGLIPDMDFVADVLYGRVAKPAAHAA